MKKRQKQIYITVTLLIVAILYTLAVKSFDVDSIGPLSSEVGFAKLNDWFHNIFDYNDFWYKLTKYLGLVPFLICGIYGLVGILQITKRKSLLKVDKRLILLGVFYVLVLITYVAFNKIVINYRPVLEDGALEASFPSSHTMMAVCICYSSLLISKYYIKKDKRKTFDIITWILMIILVVGRALSGVHWLTDIIGGVIFASFLISLYYCFIVEEEED